MKVYKLIDINYLTTSSGTVSSTLINTELYCSSWQNDRVDLIDDITLLECNAECINKSECI